MRDVVSVGTCHFNNFAYADDITLLCTTVPGLQRLINTSVEYSKMWKFNFGIKKNKMHDHSRD